MIYRLIVLNGPLKGQRITIDPEPMLVGRGEPCEIVLPDNEVALKHARFEHRGSELFIHDLGSMNKVILNKREVQDARLKHGDILELGRTRVLIEAVVQAEVQSSIDPAVVTKTRGRKRRILAAAATFVLAVTAFALTRLSGTTDNKEIEPAVTDVMFEVEPVQPIAEASALPEPEPAQAAAVAPAVAELPPVIDDELKRIREDLSYIQQHIEILNKTSAPLADAAAAEVEAVATTAAPTATPAIDDIESVMTAVREAMDASDFTQADMLLEHMQLEHPDYLPAYETRAELYETWGMPGKARDQWSAILQRTTESEIYRKAVAERVRLGRSDSQRQVNAHEAVRIQTVEQIRFRETADYDEMRLVKIRLNYNRELGPIDPDGVHLFVYFFEQDMDTKRIELSKVMPFKESTLGELQNDALDQFTMSVNYVVPKGYYSQDHNTSRQRYYGFIARLHYFDRLVDEQARPPKLLEPAILEAAGLAVHTAVVTPDAFLTTPVSN